VNVVGRLFDKPQKKLKNKQCLMHFTKCIAKYENMRYIKSKIKRRLQQPLIRGLLETKIKAKRAP
jgi:hypothetical protein